MEKKNNVGLIIIILLLVMIVLGLCGYIVYDKGLFFNSDETEEKEETNKNEGLTDESEKTEEYNYTEISNLLNDKLSGFIAFNAYDKNGVDLLSLVDLRIG